MNSYFIGTLQWSVHSTLWLVEWCCPWTSRQWLAAITAKHVWDTASWSLFVTMIYECLSLMGFWMHIGLSANSKMLIFKIYGILSESSAFLRSRASLKLSPVISGTAGGRKFRKKKTCRVIEPIQMKRLWFDLTHLFEELLNVLTNQQTKLIN